MRNPSSDAAIRLQGLSLSRRTREEYSYDFKATLFALLKGQYRRPRRRIVLDGIDLVVPHGERVGIIGPNGAGKTTLLKVCAGILDPSSGTASVEGRVAPLLELGAGFDPELSVADNVVLYGVLLGAPAQEMADKLDGILRYAELQEFRLYPVRSLSSGMTARLGFAVATDVDPDVLMLDEVLSVGDEAFRKKSRRRIEGFLANGTTTIIVSHDMATIRETCQRVIWLENGRVEMFDEVEPTIRAYLRSIDERASALVTAQRQSSSDG
jgi:ABC-type polysaccharide/polyol phosphate transport system ATPase subunit